MQLGIQAPEVYAPVETLCWSMLLWSKNIPALEALSDTKLSDCIDVVLLRSTTYGLDVLQPKNAARRNRALQRIAQGRVWRTDDGPPTDAAMPPLRGPPRTSGWADHGSSMPESKPTLDEEMKSTPKSSVTAPRQSRFQQVISAEPEGEEEHGNQTVVDDVEAAEKTSRTPSPVPSLEDDLSAFPDMAPQEATVRLDGDVRIPEGLGPSFRYMWMG